VIQALWQLDHANLERATGWALFDLSRCLSISAQTSSATASTPIGLPYTYVRH
jgi:hypothetical protein